MREEYIAAVPDEIRDQVAAAVQREVERLKAAMVRGGVWIILWVEDTLEPRP